MNAIQVSKEEQTEILSALVGLPPDQLKRKCLTPAQEEHFNRVKREFELLKEELSSHFNGQDSQLLYLGEEGEHIYLLSRWLLSFYDLIRLCWKDIKARLDEHLGKRNPYSTPGHLFAAVVWDLAEGKVYPCLQGRFDYRYKKLNELARLEKRIQDGEKKFVSKYVRGLKEVDQGLDQFHRHRGLCEEVCFSRSKKYPSPILENALRSYRTTLAALDKFNRKRSRKRKPGGISGWENGRSLTTQQAGGTYVST